MSTIGADAGAVLLDTRFDRFGLIMTWIGGNGQQVYFDDLTYACKQPQLNNVVADLQVCQYLHRRCVRAWR
jgi:hypothetical protein